LWVDVCGTVGCWRVKIELRFTNDREDMRECAIHGGAERRNQRNSGAVQRCGAAGR